MRGIDFYTELFRKLKTIPIIEGIFLLNVFIVYR